MIQMKQDYCICLFPSKKYIGVTVYCGGHLFEELPCFHVEYGLYRKAIIVLDGDSYRVISGNIARKHLKEIYTMLDSIDVRKMLQVWYGDGIV